MKCALDEQAVRWTENGVSSPAQRVVSGTKSSWRPLTTSVPLRTILGSNLFNIFSTDLADRAEWTLSEFGVDT